MRSYKLGSCSNRPSLPYALHFSIFVQFVIADFEGKKMPRKGVAKARGCVSYSVY